MSRGNADLRPLSPHLQVYRLTWLMMSSIAHRLTGLALYFGVLFGCVYLFSLLGGPETFSAYVWFLSSAFGQFFLFLSLWSFLHHMLGGVRHMLWDIGLWLDVDCANLLVRVQAFAALVAAFVIMVSGHLLI